MSFLVNQHDLLSLPHEARDLYLPKVVRRLPHPPSPLVFLREYVMPNIPVVIEGGVKHWDALTKWNDQYLKDALADNVVTVARTPNGYADAPLSGQNVFSGGGVSCDDVFVLPEELEMKFGDFLNMLNEDREDEVVYVQKQNSSFLDEFGELIRDADTHIPWATEAFGKPPDAVNFWMGSKRSITSMHKDHYENMYAVVRGSKTFILHPPTDLSCVPYEHYILCRYKRVGVGQFDIVEERLEEHCDDCDGGGGGVEGTMQRLRVDSNSSNSHTCVGTLDVNGEVNGGVLGTYNGERNGGDVTLNRHDGVLDTTDSNPLVSNITNGHKPKHETITSNSSSQYSDSAINTDVNSTNDVINTDVESTNKSINKDREPINILHPTCKCTCHIPPRVPWVAVDPLCPDYKKYPFYRYATHYEVTVYPGDLLYLPSLWFHHVRQDDGTVAVNFWYDMEYDIKYNYYKFVEGIVRGEGT